MQILKCLLTGLLSKNREAMSSLLQPTSNSMKGFLERQPVCFRRIIRLFRELV
jgi:hypothetical protein